LLYPIPKLRKSLPAGSPAAGMAGPIFLKFRESSKKYEIKPVR